MGLAGTRGFVLSVGGGCENGFRMTSEIDRKRVIERDRDREAGQLDESSSSCCRGSGCACCVFFVCLQV